MPGRTRGRWRTLALRARLLLLVVASVVPLVGMGAVREYLDYADDRDRVYETLLTIAHAVAGAVERDLQLRVSALEILAMSPALQAGNLDQFDKQAEAFLARQPAGTVMGLAGPDLQRLRAYGLAPEQIDPTHHRESTAAGAQVFDTGHPIVTDMHVGRVTHLSGFSVDVPVLRDGQVVYDLYIRLLPGVIADLTARQNLPQGGVLTVVDTAGIIVARVPAASFVGSPIVPVLWQAVRTHDEGLTKAPTLEGVPAVAAYTHVAPFGWAVIVGASEEVIFAPLRAAILRVAGLGAIALASGLVLAVFASRGITRPIEQLRRLAAHDSQIDPAASAATGLPETDTVARALVTAAAERRNVARELAESEQRFRALFERSPSGTIVLDPDTARVIDCNAAAAGYLGLTVAEFRGCPITSFALDTSPERIRQLCDAVAGGQSFSYEARVNGRLGPRNLLIAVAPMQESGRTLMLINQIDVTELRRAEAGLRANEERLELAREGANLGIWDWHIADGTVSWSEHQWRLHGLEPQPGGPSTKAWQQTLHPADLRRTLDELVTALKTPGRPFACEYSVVLPDGSLRRLLARGQTIRGGDGRAIRMVGIHMDVTARYEAEMARDRLIRILQTERSRLSDIIEALPIGVGIVDTSGRVVLGNTLMDRLVGPVIPSMDPVRSGEWTAFDADGNRLEPRAFPIQRALRLGEATLPGVEFLFRDTNGGETWFRVGSVPVRWDAGQVQQALAIFLNIDAEKRLLTIQQRINAELEQRVREEMAAREAAQQRAAHAERMHALGQIAGGIAHDFNNVLQAVSGGVALIERRPNEPERVIRNARMVQDAARRGASITSRLLAFSRRGDLRAENIDAGALLVDMAEVLTHTLGGAVVCKVEVPPGLPPLFADRGQLETVLVNLAANARDAMPAGGTLTLAADTEMIVAGLPHPTGLAQGQLAQKELAQKELAQKELAQGELAPGQYVRIVVSDTGSGMDPAVLARVTEPFFTTKAPGQGTGLGLAMAKGFVEQSGGSLSLDSVVDQGTRITLWLPASTAPSGGATTGGATTGGATTGGATTGVVPRIDAADPGKPCVLLVDDDTIVRDVLRLSLEEAGHVVLAADSGPAALARLAAGERVDILVSDLTMPGMDGLTLIQQAQSRRPGLPAVLLTGYAGDGATLAVGGAISGAFSLLRKPVSGTQLVDRITALLEARKQTSNV